MKNIRQISSILLIVVLLLTGCAGSLSEGLAEYFGRIYWDMLLYQGVYSIISMEMITVATAINLGQQDRFKFYMPADSLDEVLKLNESIKLRNSFEYFKMRIDSISIDYFGNDTLVAESHINEINMRNAESILIENGSFIESCVKLNMEYYWGDYLKGEGVISISKTDSDSSDSIQGAEKNLPVKEQLNITVENSERDSKEIECPYIFNSLFERKESGPEILEMAAVTSYLSFEFVKTRFDTLRIRKDELRQTYRYEEILPILDSADKNLVDLLENLDND